jgi:hypothetical protein
MVLTSVMVGKTFGGVGGANCPVTVVWMLSPLAPINNWADPVPVWFLECPIGYSNGMFLFA